MGALTLLSTQFFRGPRRAPGPTAGGLATLVPHRYGRYIGRVTFDFFPAPAGGRESSPSVCTQVVEAALPTIGVIAGDGIGPEVVAEGLAVLAEAAERDGFHYETVAFDLGGERYLKTGEVLPDAV